VLERSWVSGFDADSLRRVAALEPELPRSFTMPRDRLGVSKRGPLAPLVRGALRTIGASLPGRIASVLDRARATALTLHHSVASAEAIARAHELGAPVYVWTVDDRKLAEKLARWGADGIITNDPRVFTGLTT
jgi:glycerophosphoryl diester phosphodiesterase